MSEHLANFKVWDAALVNGTGSLTSAVLRLHWLARVECLTVKVTSVAGVPAIKVEYAISPDGTNFGSFDDYTDLIADTSAFATPEGWTDVAVPNMLGPYIKLKATGLAANQTDSLLTLILVGREKL